MNFINAQVEVKRTRQWNKTKSTCYLLFLLILLPSVPLNALLLHFIAAVLLEFYVKWGSPVRSHLGAHQNTSCPFRKFSVLVEEKYFSFGWQNCQMTPQSYRDWKMMITYTWISFTYSLRISLRVFILKFGRARYRNHAIFARKQKCKNKSRDSNRKFLSRQKNLGRRRRRENEILEIVDSQGMHS